MTPDLLAEIAAEANLAPSVHNTQPVRWQRDGTDALLLTLDPARRLAVGDPNGRDARLSGGAALLGTQYALWRRGIGLRGVEIAGDRVRIALGGGAQDPPALELLRRRTSYRAGFAPAGADVTAALTALAAARADVAAITDTARIRETSRLNDTASLGVMRDAGFRAELLSWMRLRPGHPDWHRDGLSAEALAMRRLEAMGAGLVLRTPVFETLDALRLSRGVVAEAARTETAATLLAFHRPAAEDRWTTGQAFYDLWIALTRIGCAAWPMAVLADDPAARQAVTQRLALADDRALITVLRVGPHPGARQPPKARLSGADLVKDA
ncbi:MAG: hypothetical protein AAGE76_01390 [Pseudomonadota bacterium]